MLRGRAVRLGNSAFDQKLNRFAQNPSHCCQLLLQHSHSEGFEMNRSAKQNRRSPAPSVIGILSLFGGL